MTISVKLILAEKYYRIWKNVHVPVDSCAPVAGQITHNQGVDRTVKSGKTRTFFLTGKNRENPGNFI